MLIQQLGGMRKMSKENKKVIAVLIIVLLFLTCNFIYNFIDSINFEKIRKSGDDKWKLVEERLLEMEEKINKLEVQIDE